MHVGRTLVLILIALGISLGAFWLRTADGTTTPIQAPPLPHL
jgi:hypothetical protein